MNIWGAKRHIKEINQELKKGTKKLGEKRFNELQKRKDRYLAIIKNERAKRKKK